MRHVNTSGCEQFCSFLTKFRCFLRGFNYPTSSLFTLLLFNLQNCHTVGVDDNDFGLGSTHFSDQTRSHFLGPYVFHGIYYDQYHLSDDDSDETIADTDSGAFNDIVFETDMDCEQNDWWSRAKSSFPVIERKGENTVSTISHIHGWKLVEIASSASFISTTSIISTNFLYW